jgi:hypothetical protein
VVVTEPTHLEHTPKYFGRYSRYYEQNVAVGPQNDRVILISEKAIAKISPPTNNQLCVLKTTKGNKTVSLKMYHSCSVLVIHGEDFAYV